VRTPAAESLGAPASREYVRQDEQRDVQEHLRHSTIETTADVYMQLLIPQSVRDMVEADIADVLPTYKAEKLSVN
jgi:hypothetical protein